MATELHDLSIAELSGLIAARKLSPVELVEALIRRGEQYDEQTHAFITRTSDLARQQAKAAEAEIAAGKYRGASHGIPFALKDIYDTRGILTSGHSRVFIDRIPREDATATTKLYDAGAVLLGKLATHEMAHAGPSFDLPGLLRATPGTSRTSREAPRRDRVLPWRPAWSRWRSARTPVDRSGARRRSVASSVSCRRSAW
jgi:hypothetical protein